MRAWHKKAAKPEHAPPQGRTSDLTTFFADAWSVTSNHKQFGGHAYVADAFEEVGGQKTTSIRCR
jgi:hypothetical protein